MGTAVVPLSIEQRYELLRFGLQCLDLLAIDELWSEAVAGSDPSASGTGRDMVRLMQDLQHRTQEVGNIILPARYELNAYWPELRDYWGRTAHDEMSALDGWIEEQGGRFGDVGVSINAGLAGELSEAINEITHKVSQLEEGSEPEGDLSKQKRTWIAVFAACCLVTVSLPVIGAGMGAVGVAAGAFTGVMGLAGVAASIAGGAILLPEGGSVPPPSGPTPPGSPTS